MKSPADMKIIQIEITDACPKKCGNCTRLVPHIRQPFMMIETNFASIVRSMEGWPGMVLGVMGGEPTVHPQFAQIAEVFAEMWGPKGPLENGKHPIRDYSAYVNERLHDPSSRRGLWSSLGKKYYEHYELIQRVFSYQCVNTHENPGYHQSILISRDEIKKEMGITDDQWLENRDKCWVQNTWSASVNPHGAYFCEVAGAIDNLLYQGKSAWKVEEGWWKRQPSWDFKDQLHLCNHCALAQKSPSVQANKDKDIIGRMSLPLLEAVGSPMVKKGNFEVFDVNAPRLEIDDRIDRYMPEPQMRVSPDHNSVKPKHLTAIMVCVGRAEYLAKTIEQNRKMVDRLIIVTDKEDDKTMKVIRDANVKFDPIYTSCYRTNGDAFNKGKMLQEAIEYLYNIKQTEIGDWWIFTDCDVFLNPGLMDFVKGRALNPGCLYGTHRWDVSMKDADDIPKPDRKWSFKERLFQKHGNLSQEPNGYFQLFSPNASIWKGKVKMSPSFCSAGGIDSWFMQQYPKNNRIMIPQIPVIHIDHDNGLGSGWNGNSDRRAEWVQCGMINSANQYIPIIPGIEKENHIYRLTDTRHGVSLVDIARDQEDLALIANKFRDQTDSEGCHIHVAFSLDQKKTKEIFESFVFKS